VVHSLHGGALTRSSPSLVWLICDCILAHLSTASRSAHLGSLRIKKICYRN